MFIVEDAVDDSSSVRSVMSILRPDGTGGSLYMPNYKYFVPTGILRPLLR
ncbi:MAG: hypothetical protein V7641_1949 [Blastocatellia bacterium]